jgi:DNA-binding CsgD family transcriptional regulator
LGSEGFVEKLKLLLADQAALKEIPRRECLATRPSLAELFADIPDKQARNQQIHEVVRVPEYTLKEVGDFLGLDYSTISGLQSASMKRRNTKNKDLTLSLFDNAIG